MSSWWPFGRRPAHPAAPATAAPPLPVVQRSAWRELPPMPAVAAETAPVAEFDSFTASLATSQRPALTGPLPHVAIGNGVDLTQLPAAAPASPAAAPPPAPAPYRRDFLPAMPSAVISSLPKTAAVQRSSGLTAAPPPEAPRALTPAAPAQPLAGWADPAPFAIETPSAAPDFTAGAAPMDDADGAADPSSAAAGSGSLSAIASSSPIATPDNGPAVSASLPAPVPNPAHAAPVQRALSPGGVPLPVPTPRPLPRLRVQRETGMPPTESGAAPPLPAAPAKALPEWHSAETPAPTAGPADITASSPMELITPRPADRAPTVHTGLQPAAAPVQRAPDGGPLVPRHFSTATPVDTPPSPANEPQLAPPPDLPMPARTLPLADSPAVASPVHRESLDGAPQFSSETPVRPPSIWQRSAIAVQRAISALSTSTAPRQEPQHPPPVAWPAPDSAPLAATADTTAVAAPSITETLPFPANAAPALPAPVSRRAESSGAIQRTVSPPADTPVQRTAVRPSAARPPAAQPDPLPAPAQPPGPPPAPVPHVSAEFIPESLPVADIPHAPHRIAASSPMEVPAVQRHTSVELPNLLPPSRSSAPTPVLSPEPEHSVHQPHPIRSGGIGQPLTSVTPTAPLAPAPIHRTPVPRPAGIGAPLPAPSSNPPPVPAGEAVPVNEFFALIAEQSAAPPDPVQRSAEDSDTAELVQREPAAASITPAPGAPSAAPASTPADLEALAHKLYEPLAARLKAELWLDRERAGHLTDPRF